MLPYNNKDIVSIFDYSKQLVNKCLRDFAPDADEHKGKGGLGQLVEELFFKYDVNFRLRFGQRRTQMHSAEAVGKWHRTADKGTACL